MLISAKLALLLLFCSAVGGRIRRGRFLTKRKTPSAFSLARLQKNYDDEDETEEFGETKSGRGDKSRRRDEVVNDGKCLQRCNNQLNIGMDMVNAHMAFGSIDVPSVAEPRDLKLFCLLDKQHNDCGYSVQFNLREYVCRHRFHEMLQHQPCFSRAAPYLLRHCRPRCGSYVPLEHSLSGYASRCRQLLCDHTCTNFIMDKICGEAKGKRAGDFLLDFTRLQVEYWIRDFAKSKNISPNSAYPASCARLQCDGFKSKSCHVTNLG